MEKKLCPTCKKTTNCILKEEGILNYLYKCSECQTEFKNPTILKEAASVAPLVMLGIVVGNELTKKS